jgi:hypothetical protein
MKWTIRKKEAVEYLEKIAQEEWIVRYSNAKPLIEKTLREQNLAELKRWAKFFKNKSELIRLNSNK